MKGTFILPDGAVAAWDDLVNEGSGVKFDSGWRWSDGRKSFTGNVHDVAKLMMRRHNSDIALYFITDFLHMQIYLKFLPESERRQLRQAYP